MKSSDWFFVAVGVGLLLWLGKGVYSFMGELSASQLKSLAANAGFSGSDLDTAAAIALAESSGNPNAYGDPSAGGSYGLWQINAKYHPEFGPDFTTLYDPQTNANAAYQVYKTAGYSFTPWSTFNSGAFISYLSSVQNA
jgi:hypothetical protein